tara:strand:+ start:434 stop:850 length:417 start_codon:yes stop_codon:yes gene_type:complete
MKKIFSHFYLVIIFAFLYSINSNAIIFECENEYSYKMNKKDEQLIFFYKKKNTKWQSINNVKKSNNKLEFFLPDSTYLACSDKKLNICNYKSLILFDISTKQASVREVVINDCYIGTMGCNKYEKGLELNQRRCNIIE